MAKAEVQRQPSPDELKEAIACAWVEITDSDFAMATEEVILSLTHQREDFIKNIQTIERNLAGVIGLINQAQRSRDRGLIVRLMFNEITNEITLDIKKKNQMGFHGAIEE